MRRPSRLRGPMAIAASMPLLVLIPPALTAQPAPGGSTVRPSLTLSQEQASAFARLALKGIGKEYPNKPGHVLTGDADLSTWGAEYIAGMEDILAGRQAAVDRDQEKLFWGPTAVAVDGEGRVLVVVSCRHRIQVYRRY